MTNESDTISCDDPFNLNRFISAQAPVYERVLAELRSGQKRTHWMWYIVPQIDGLGYSTTSKHYAVKSTQEARAYLNHSLLGSRLLECAEAVLGIEGRKVSDIFSYPDDLKLKSSMTLFACIGGPGSVFVCVLEKYFQGERDVRTLLILESSSSELR